MKYIVFIFALFFFSNIAISQINPTIYIGSGISNIFSKTYVSDYGYSDFFDLTIDEYKPNFLINFGGNTSFKVFKKKEFYFGIEFSRKSAIYLEPYENFKKYPIYKNYIRFPFTLRSIRARKFRGNFLIIPNIYIPTRKDKNNKLAQYTQPLSWSLQYMMIYQFNTKMALSFHLESDITTFSKYTGTLPTNHDFFYGAYLRFNYKLF